MIYALVAIFVLMGVTLFLILKTHWRMNDLKYSVDTLNTRIEKLIRQIDAMEPVKIVREKEKED